MTTAHQSAVAMPPKAMWAVSPLSALLGRGFDAACADRLARATLPP